MLRVSVSTALVLLALLVLQVSVSRARVPLANSSVSARISSHARGHSTSRTACNRSVRHQHRQGCGCRTHCTFCKQTATVALSWQPEYDEMFLPNAPLALEFQRKRNQFQRKRKRKRNRKRKQIAPVSPRSTHAPVSPRSTHAAPSFEATVRRVLRVPVSTALVLLALLVLQVSVSRAWVLLALLVQRVSVSMALVLSALLPDEFPPM